MTDTVLAAPNLAAALKALASRAAAVAMFSLAVIREWRRRARSRAEIAMYSHDDRADLGYAAELDGEIGKPFWRP